jgi:putative oxidoreductase
MFDRFFARLLGSRADVIYALLRIVAGFLFLLHGLQKFGVLSDKQADIWSQRWIGGGIEVITGALIVIGFSTRLATFIASGQMAVAYFQFHWKLALDERFFPVVNRGSSAVLFCFVFLFFAAQGPGIWSVDGRRR